MIGHHVRYGFKNVVNIDFGVVFLDFLKLNLQLQHLFELYFTIIVKTSALTLQSQLNKMATSAKINISLNYISLTTGQTI